MESKHEILLTKLWKKSPQHNVVYHLEQAAHFVEREEWEYAREHVREALLKCRENNYEIYLPYMKMIRHLLGLVEAWRLHPALLERFLTKRVEKNYNSYLKKYTVQRFSDRQAASQDCVAWMWIFDRNPIVEYPDDIYQRMVHVPQLHAILPEHVKYVSTAAIEKYVHNFVILSYRFADTLIKVSDMTKLQAFLTTTDRASKMTLTKCLTTFGRYGEWEKLEEFLGIMGHQIGTAAKWLLIGAVKAQNRDRVSHCLSTFELDQEACCSALAAAVNADAVEIATMICAEHRGLGFHEDSPILSAIVNSNGDMLSLLMDTGMGFPYDEIIDVVTYGNPKSLDILIPGIRRFGHIFLTDGKKNVLLSKAIRKTNPALYQVVTDVVMCDEILLYDLD